MPRSQLIILIALVTVLIIGGIAAFALSRPKEQIAVLPKVATTQIEPRLTATQTELSSPVSTQPISTLPVIQVSLTPTFTVTPIPTAQNTVIPLDSTFVPMPTPVRVETRIGPTITPSGPLIKFEDQNTQRLQDHFPKQLGGLDFDVAKDPWAVGVLNAEHQYGPNQRLGILITLNNSPNFADAIYRALLIGKGFKHPQAIDVGDEAIVDTQHAATIGLMRFRNAVVEVSIFSFSAQADPSINNETIIRILEDVKQYLEKESLQ